MSSPFDATEHAVARREPALALASREPGIMDLIARAIEKGDVQSVEIIERLSALKIQIEDREAKRVFADALAGLQERLPQMDKDGQSKNSKYAKLESIDILVRPLLAEHGFSLSFDEESHAEKTVTFVAVLSHRGGHSESKRLTVPYDTAAKNREGNSIRPAIQDAGSTVSYARRYLLKMHLNIIEKEEDTDGESKKRISPEQVKDLGVMIQDTKSDMARFLRHFRLEKLEDMLFTQYGEALQMLQQKAAK